jgi:RimJ/RimL family protein N-acetyltransferase
MAHIAARRFTQRDGRSAEIRVAQPADAAAMLEYLEAVSGESDFLTFGPGEFAISVRRSHWGRRIGAELLDALIGWARGVDTIRKIGLRVRTDNARGIGLYRDKGFVLEGTLRSEICIAGKYFDLYYMGLLR